MSGDEIFRTWMLCYLSFHVALFAHMANSPGLTLEGALGLWAFCWGLWLCSRNRELAEERERLNAETKDEAQVEAEAKIAARLRAKCGSQPLKDQTLEELRREDYNKAMALLQRLEREASPKRD